MKLADANNFIFKIFKYVYKIAQFQFLYEKKLLFYICIKIFVEE